MDSFGKYSWLNSPTTSNPARLLLVDRYGMDSDPVELPFKDYSKVNKAGTNKSFVQNRRNNRGRAKILLLNGAEEASWQLSKVRRRRACRFGIPGKRCK